MAPKTIVLITGGNTGIGYETVKALYASPTPHTILMGSRSLDKANTAISALKSENTSSQSEIIPLQIDIEDDDSIDNAYKEVEQKFGHVDTLINNAGASFDSIQQEKPGKDGIREAWSRCYSLNVVATQIFTTAFISLLIRSDSPRLLFITSGLSSLTTCSKGVKAAFVAEVPTGWPKPYQHSHTAYRASKTALNMMMLDWDRLLKVDGVKVFAISPGFLATGLGGAGADTLRKLGAGDPSIGGHVIKDVVEGKRDADAGQVVSKDGVQPW